MSGWQPIETAPKDKLIRLGQWHDEGNWLEFIGQWGKPTHSFGINSYPKNPDGSRSDYGWCTLGGAWLGDDNQYWQLYELPAYELK